MGERYVVVIESDLIVDPELHEAGRVAVKVFLEANMLFAELMSQDFHDREAFDEFKEQIRAELQNPDYHLYAVMYGLIARY